MSQEPVRNAASFRDPSGFIFSREGRVYRQVNPAYRENYDRLIQSGLYDRLVSHNLLIPHTEVDLAFAATPDAYKVIRPDPIPFISYPYEWCFSQLKDAALLTLTIQLTALEFDLSLKDSSAYNVQFHRGRPLFIDTLSFEPYRAGQPWVAYRQFCQHFLAPLALMSLTDIRLQQLLRVYLDGVPLDLASRLLPAKSWLNFALLSHIHLHAKSQQKFAGRSVSTEGKKISRTSFLGLLDNLKSAIEKLTWQPTGTEWHDYYQILNYSPAALSQKEQLVAGLLDELSPRPQQVWDLGANTGLFSRVAAERAALTVSFDLDAGAVEKNYRAMAAADESNLLPLVLDLTNPSPGLGWAGRERHSIFERGPADVVLALALMHHLAVGNNLPFAQMAQFFSQICRRALIIEFVPKQDPQLQRLLQNRVDIFEDYTPQTFEQNFSRYFTIQARQPLPAVERTLYLMLKRPATE